MSAVASDPPYATLPQAPLRSGVLLELQGGYEAGTPSDIEGLLDAGEAPYPRTHRRVYKSAALAAFGFGAAVLVGAATLTVSSSRAPSSRVTATADAQQALFVENESQMKIYNFYERSCQHFGCGNEYDERNVCQCNELCIAKQNCCVDYDRLCVAPPAMAKDFTDSVPTPDPTSPSQVLQTASLYCFSLMMPFGYERGLLAAIYERNAGIFQCEAYQIFSNATLEVVPGLKSYPVEGTLQVKYGGKWDLALNTDVFIKVWNMVEYLGEYRNHDWSIKADPDTVFFAERFRAFVTRTTSELVPGPLVPTGPTFLNNCRYGLHGPLEAVSREGMEVFLREMDTGCSDIHAASMDLLPQSVLAGMRERDHAYGEDQFLRRCLRQLGVMHIDEFESLLMEKFACEDRPRDCGGAKVSYHAFKTPDDWFRCYDQATGSGKWPSSTAIAAANAAALPSPMYSADTADGFGEEAAYTESTTQQPAASPNVGDIFRAKLAFIGSRIFR